MRVFVAGAAGAIGVRLVPQLVARGHQVTATTKSETKLRLLRELGAEPVMMDGLDRGSVNEAVTTARPDVIVHEMTALSGKANMKHFDRWMAVTNQLRIHGTSHLLAAAMSAGVGKIVAQSYTGWNNGRTGNRIKTESDPLDPYPARAQVNSLRAVRYLEGALQDAPVDAVVLRYGGFYGPGASDEFVDLARKRKLPVVGSGAGVWSWIHLDDAAAATVAAVERGAPGVYNVVDDEPAPVYEWLPYLAEAVGGKPPRKAPGWLARLAIGQAGVRWMTTACGAANEKARRELGWRLRYPSWRAGFRHGLHAAPLDAAALAELIGAPRAAGHRPAPRPPTLRPVERDRGR
ncbi:MAG TPA: NAD(P)-dependent oxidoreductase [Jatrophihabitans sp.]|jgi:nucleoside-diphosphate-sugar epimerase|nr:NAD(P)-dependent oxidoreductase [Jatrophihabitans sp.]